MHDFQHTLRQLMGERIVCSKTGAGTFGCVYKKYKTKNPLFIPHQWEQTREPRNRPTFSSDLIFDKCMKTIQWKNKSLFNK